MEDINESSIHVFYMMHDHYVMISSSKENSPDLFSFDEAMNSEY